MRIHMALFCALFIFSPNAQAAIQTEEVEYQSGGAVLKGFIAYDDAIEGKRPGVIVVHEWWGHNKYVRQRAFMLAELGYTALAIDMYGDGKQARHPDDAGAFAKEVMSQFESTGKNRFLAGMEVLKNHPTVDPDRIAAIGYCFGGSAVLNMARLGTDLDAVVSFHGSLASSVKAQEGNVKPFVLVCHGQNDQMISQEDISAFKEEMTNAKASYQFKVYPGAQHSFTNPEADYFAKEYHLPIGYNEAADKRSWQDMIGVFNIVFKE